MHLPPHGISQMIWENRVSDMMPMETILFRPPLANFYCNVCVGVRGIYICVQMSTNLESPPIMGN